MRAMHVFATDLGPMTAVEEDGRLTWLAFEDERAPREDTAREETPLIRRAVAQVREYLAGKRTSFDVPLQPEGTAFQRDVWQALLDIPYGETRSYGQIAAAVGRPKAFRAVGMANHNNPISLIIPCHRVIGADGSLTGYGGGLPIKEKLLRLEKAAFRLPR